MINVSKQEKKILDQVCVGLGDTGQVGSGESVVWTSGHLFSLWSGRRWQRQLVFYVRHCLNPFRIPVFDFNLMNNNLARRLEVTLSPNEEEKVTPEVKKKLRKRCVYVCICVCVCMCICVCVCMYICVCIYVYVCMHVCIVYVCMRVCVYVCMCVNVCV